MEQFHTGIRSFDVLFFSRYDRGGKRGVAVLICLCEHHETHVRITLSRTCSRSFVFLCELQNTYGIRIPKHMFETHVQNTYQNTCSKHISHTPKHISRTRNTCSKHMFETHITHMKHISHTSVQHTRSRGVPVYVALTVATQQFQFNSCRARS